MTDASQYMELFSGGREWFSADFEIISGKPAFHLSIINGDCNDPDDDYGEEFITLNDEQAVALRDWLIHWTGGRA